MSSSTMISRRHWCRLATAVMWVSEHSILMRCMRCSALVASSPVVGSSKQMVSGLLISAAATCSRLRSPDERPPWMSTPYALSTPPTCVSMQ
jgi:hypothetical protein